MTKFHFSPKYCNILRNRDFAFLWSGQLVSQLGDALFYIAKTWLIIDLTGSALAVGTAMIFFELPCLLLQVFGGAAVDRLDRRKIMLTADIMRSLVVFIFAVLVYTNAITMWHIYILAMAFGVVSAFFDPAQMAVLPMIINKDEVVPANALYSMTIIGAYIVGTSLGSLFISIPNIGVAGISFFNALSFTIGAVGIWLIRSPLSIAAGNGKQPFSALVFDGFRYLCQCNPVVLSLLTIGEFLNIAAKTIMIVLIPIFAREVLHLGAQGFGAMEVSIMIGLFVGYLTMGSMGVIPQHGLWIIGTGILQGIIIISLAMSKNIISATTILLLFGSINGMSNVVYNSYLQETVDDEYRGRVFSLYIMITGGLQLVGYGFAGYLADSFGVLTVFLASGIGMVLIAASGTLLRPIMALR